MNRITHFFSSWEGLLAAQSVALPENPVTLHVGKDEMVNVLASNILKIITNRPPFFSSDDEQQAFERLEAERRDFLEWAKQCPTEQLVVAMLPCRYDGGEGGEL